MQTHKKTIETYDKYAQAYDQNIIEFWDNFPKEFIKTFAGSLAGKRVLNLGSGSGRDALLLRAHDIEVVCVDAAKAMIEQTRKLGFESHHTSFAKMSFPDHSFDGVWAHGSLLHIAKQDAPKLVAHIRKLLKPDGVCAIGVIQGNGSALIKHESLARAPRFFQMYSEEDLRNLMKAHGFGFLYGHDYDPGYDVFLNHIYRSLPLTLAQ